MQQTSISQFREQVDHLVASAVEKIREAVKGGAVTQIELSAASGVSQSTISEMVSGKKTPRLQTLEALIGGLTELMESGDNAVSHDSQPVGTSVPVVFPPTHTPPLQVEKKRDPYVGTLPPDTPMAVRFSVSGSPLPVYELMTFAEAQKAVRNGRVIHESAHGERLKKIPQNLIKGGRR